MVSFTQKSRISGTPSDSVSIASEAQSKISVATPSFVLPSPTVASRTTAHIHASNPNPSPKKARFRSVRDIGLNFNEASELEKRTIEKMKFGKRILFDKPISNKEVLELHISAMHEQMQRKREEYEKTKLEHKRHTEQLLREAHNREAEKL